MDNKICIIVVGPTAVGKTEAAIQLARQYSTQIISADSRQCFTELNAGVAKPSSSQLSEVPHHFINSHSIHNEVTAVTFENYAIDKIQLIFQDTDVAVMVGGTGLYIKAFCEGFDAVPTISVTIREEILQSFNQKGFEWLYSEIQTRDPLYFEKGEMKNPQRMMRALEVKNFTGNSILNYRSGNKKQRYFKIIKIGLELPREELNKRIDNRIKIMLDAGLLKEVEGLFPYKDLNALQTVGYRELFEFLEERYTFDEAIQKIKTHTHRYAKRQMTWFKKDPGVAWQHPESPILF